MKIRAPDNAFDHACFTHARLERILPIARTQQAGPMDFTLIAIECYAAGFAATVLLEQDWRMPEPIPPADELELPCLLRGLPLVTEIGDDLGNSYTGYMRACIGGGGRDEGLYNHLVYCFAPALDPAARSLSFTLTQVERPAHDAEGRPVWRDDQIVGGPWPLSFPLEQRSAQSATVTVPPVARRICVDALCVTVTTVERHAWGFGINSRFDWADPDGPFPQPVWRASDDRGADYGRASCGGDVNSTSDDVRSRRMYCEFRSDVDPEATELRLRLTAPGPARTTPSQAMDVFMRGERLRDAANLGELTVALPPR